MPRPRAPPGERVGSGDESLRSGEEANWASVSEPHTSELNRDFYLSYVVPYVFDAVI